MPFADLAPNRIEELVGRGRSSRIAKVINCIALVVESLHAVRVVGHEELTIGCERDAERPRKRAKIAAALANMHRRRAICSEYTQTMIAIIGDARAAVGQRD